ncbi:hypothetical protein [Roseomonas xinghualingensis]|uniref:hypothetical protein n=1 Tax=Roseomonas xinghualingensis TaxID=2986475 RepID=UPI0021F17F77|nr:hypothetical protein [Roseomonas sp. SXEYE001]MCV4208581.1 hypothetical protein [Roseomonas sp. SXEYE001]
MDMSTTVAPKSNQLNADDLIAGPRTITITKVSGTGNGDQPVAVSFEGDNSKPYLPCKSMRRVMIAAWGPDAAQYVGRAMTLYRDARVAFGGMEVGGIRISHMSHIEREMVMALTVTKAKRAPYTVKPLRQAPQQQSAPAQDKASGVARDLIARIKDADSAEVLEAITGDAKVVQQREWLTAKRPELAADVDAAVRAALDALPQDADAMPPDDDFPGDRPLESAQ